MQRMAERMAKGLLQAGGLALEVGWCLGAWACGWPGCHGRVCARTWFRPTALTKHALPSSSE
jgi:hypothetical protein